MSNVTLLPTNYDPTGPYIDPREAGGTLAPLYRGQPYDPTRPLLNDGLQAVTVDPYAPILNGSTPYSSSDVPLYQTADPIGASQALGMLEFAGDASPKYQPVSKTATEVVPADVAKPAIPHNVTLLLVSALVLGIVLVTAQHLGR